MAYEKYDDNNFGSCIGSDKGLLKYYQSIIETSYSNAPQWCLVQVIGNKEGLRRNYIFYNNFNPISRKFVYC